jgi:hypothetical protein
MLVDIDFEEPINLSPNQILQKIKDSVL